jgi:hypothetical protein
VFNAGDDATDVTQRLESRSLPHGFRRPLAASGSAPPAGAGPTHTLDPRGDRDAGRLPSRRRASRAGNADTVSFVGYRRRSATPNDAVRARRPWDASEALLVGTCALQAADHGVADAGSPLPGDPAPPVPLCRLMDRFVASIHPGREAATGRAGVRLSDGEPVRSGRLASSADALIATAQLFERSARSASNRLAVMHRLRLRARESGRTGQCGPGVTGCRKGTAASRDDQRTRR